MGLLFGTAIFGILCLCLYNYIKSKNNHKRFMDTFYAESDYYNDTYENVSNSGGPGPNYYNREGTREPIGPDDGCGLCRRRHKHQQMKAAAENNHYEIKFKDFSTVPPVIKKPKPHHIKSIIKEKDVPLSEKDINNMNEFATLCNTNIEAEKLVKAKAAAQEKAKLAAAKAQEEARVRAEKIAKAQEEAKARAQAQAKAKAEAEAKEKADAMAKFETKARAAEIAKLEMETKARAKSKEKANISESSKVKETNNSYKNMYAVEN